MQRPFLLQTYRDMGGGNFVAMKEAAAPITIGGRHWGGLRLASRFWTDRRRFEVGWRPEILDQAPLGGTGRWPGGPKPMT